MSSLPLETRLAQIGRDLRQELSEGKELSGSFFCRMGKLFVEELLDAEVTDTLGRDKGERREPSGDAGGYRNGFKPRTLRTGEGRIELDVPQVQDFFLAASRDTGGNSAKRLEAADRGGATAGPRGRGAGRLSRRRIGRGGGAGGAAVNP